MNFIKKTHCLYVSNIEVQQGLPQPMCFCIEDSCFGDPDTCLDRDDKRSVRMGWLLVHTAVDNTNCIQSLQHSPRFC